MWRITLIVALLFSFSVVAADAEVTRPNTVRDIKYAYEGIYVGFDFGF